jgi:hypothetical protein
MQAHEYTIIGKSRTNIGRYLGVIAGGLAAAMYLMAGAILTFLKTTPFTDWIPDIVFWPLSAGVIYIAVHFAFDKWAWKWPLVSKVLDIPNIQGLWDCKGETKDADGNTIYEWNGCVAIAQTWEKINVRLKTKQSASHSMVAALVNEGDQGYRLIYRYTNEPKAGEPLNHHIGFCDLRFNKSLTKAEGDYFNKGRWTFGQMTLTKREKNDD